MTSLESCNDYLLHGRQSLWVPLIAHGGTTQRGPTTHVWGRHLLMWHHTLLRWPRRRHWHWLLWWPRLPTSKRSSRRWPSHWLLRQSAHAPSRLRLETTLSNFALLGAYKGLYQKPKSQEANRVRHNNCDLIITWPIGGKAIGCCGWLPGAKPGTPCKA